jgi:hypothetical protein
VRAFEEVHGQRITGSLTMFDRLIFKGHLPSLYKNGGTRAFLWNQAEDVPLAVELRRRPPW